MIDLVCKTIKCNGYLTAHALCAGFEKCNIYIGSQLIVQLPFIFGGAMIFFWTLQVFQFLQIVHAISLLCFPPLWLVSPFHRLWGRFLCPSGGVTSSRETPATRVWVLSQPSVELSNLLFFPTLDMVQIVGVATKKSGSTILAWIARQSA